MVTCPQQVESRTGKVRRPKTGTQPVQWVWYVVRTLDDASDHILSFLDGRDALVAGTTSTYKHLRDTLDVIVSCGYFTRPVCDDTKTSGDDLHSMRNVHLCVCCNEMIYLLSTGLVTVSDNPLNTQQLISQHPHSRFQSQINWSLSAFFLCLTWARGNHPSGLIPLLLQLCLLLTGSIAHSAKRWLLNLPRGRFSGFSFAGVTRYTYGG